MNARFFVLASSPLFLQFRAILISMAMLAIPAIVMAQWPTTYLSPKVLASAPELYAADVCATPDGGAIVIVDTVSGNIRQADILRFDQDGTLVWSRPNLPQLGAKGVRFQIRPYNGTFIPNGDWLITTAYASPVNPTVAQTLMIYHDSGNELQNFAGGYLPKDITWRPDTDMVVTMYNPADGRILLNNETQNTGESFVLNHLTVRNFQGEMLDESLMGLVYTATADVQARASQIQLVIYRAGLVFLRRVPFPEDSYAEDHGRVTKYTDQSFMVSWISDPGVTAALYTNTYNHSGNELTSPVKCLDTVVDYMTTESTIGLPVFAAVQRDTASYPPVDTLIGGIINPENGGTAYLTVASAPGIKLKTLRQEADGNFSLVYSIPENGTNLLKVRRISGTTAATLWETTVADLGIASDEKIKAYPNTFVSGNDDSVLFILTRRDEPGTANTAFQLVRLGPDGQLGGNI